MTRPQFDEFLKHKGRVKYRGRLYYTPNDKATGEHESIYLYEASTSGTKWFVATKQELLAPCYEYIPQHEQMIIDRLAKILAHTVVEAQEVRDNGSSKN